jgi:hypothetical protein
MLPARDEALPPAHVARGSAGVSPIARTLPLMAALVVTSLLAAFNAWAIFSRIDSPPHAADFYLYYLAAQVARGYGWVHLYDPATFLAALQGSSDRLTPYLNPPPLAALVLPLSYLPYRLALGLWFALMLGALLLAWYLAAPGAGWARAAHLTAIAGLYLVGYGLQMGQAIFLVLAGLAVCWWLLRRGHHGWAGMALALMAVKPQVALLVPPALLLAGYRRTVLAWAAGVIPLAAISWWAIGPTGVFHYRQSLAIAYKFPSLQLETLASVFSGGPAVPAMAALAGAVALLVAWRSRGRGPELPVAAGVLGSLLITPYALSFDLVILVLAAWLVMRANPPRWQKVLLLLGYVPLEFATWIAKPVVIFECIWLVSLLFLTVPIFREAGVERPASARGRPP